MLRSTVTSILAASLSLGACGTADSPSTTANSGVSATSPAVEPWSEFSDEAADFITDFLPPVDLLLGFRLNVSDDGCSEAREELRLLRTRIERRSDALAAVPLVDANQAPLAPFVDLLDLAIEAQADHCIQVQILEERRRQAIANIPSTASQDVQFDKANEIISSTRDLIFDSYSDDYRHEMRAPRTRLLVTACLMVRKFPEEADRFSAELADAYLGEYEDAERKMRVRLGFSPQESVESRARQLFLDDFGQENGFLTRLCPSP